MTIAPRYDQYKDAWDTNVTVEVKKFLISKKPTPFVGMGQSNSFVIFFNERDQMPVGDQTLNVRFFHCYKRGVDRVFVDHPMFLEKVM